MAIKKLSKGEFRLEESLKNKIETELLGFGGSKLFKMLPDKMKEFIAERRKDRIFSSMMPSAIAIAMSEQERAEKNRKLLEEIAKRREFAKTH